VISNCAVGGRGRSIKILEQAANKAQCACLLDRCRAIIACIVAPEVLGVQRKGFACVGGKHDASKAEPSMVTTTTHPHDLTIGEHIDAGCLGIVVHIEDQSLLWSAVCRKSYH
jgi:hypothetical protein